MAPAALALVRELSRKGFWPFSGKLHSLQIQHATQMLKQRKPI